MTDDRQERIRRRAHEIWEQAGRPEGSHIEHWEQAIAEIDGEKPKPEAAPKKAAAAKADKPKAVKAEKPKAPAKTAAKPKAKT
ncbi:DUF2934 domain-containing protein [Mesorhizobium tamadayense]|uniref:DUF2934 domain-containing protein n=1 Tax=Mesorhizobium tamadayense TaxID=425306 RepID=A0A3P3F944_9HYPH|nr:DUF2934 domain-containing protein [Mesorhizobium tamadayense]RRH94796.1 DUF2934 domain-containing protein [Mesorhizobium tamadayense]